MGSQKNKQLYSASSLGGRIKVRKTEASNYCLIVVIDNNASTEISAKTAIGSPNSSNQLQTDSNKAQGKQSEPDINSRPRHTSTTNAPDYHRNSHRATHLNEHSNSNRSQQWQRMRSKLNHQHEQNRNGQRSRQQDLGRQITLCE